MCIDFLFILSISCATVVHYQIYFLQVCSKSMSDRRTSYKVLSSIRGTRPILKVLGKNDLINVGLVLVFGFFS